MGALRFDGADWVRFATLAAALANVSDGAFTYALLLKRATIGTFQAPGYLTAAGVAQQGLSFNTTNNLFEDNGSAGQSPSTFASTASPYLFVLSKAAGSIAPTLSWKLGSGGAWTDETWTNVQVDKAVADALEIGTLAGGSDLLNAWVGVAAWWEGAMSAAQKQELDNNWRTSDWWNSSFGQPQALIECNVAAASLVDLAGNATNLSVTGTPTLDAAETLDSWNFDGKGGAAAVVLPTAPRPRAFQEQGRIYSGEKTGFQPLAFQIPDPTRAFQEGVRFGEQKAFQDQAFQQPDPSIAFQPEAFDDFSVFQMSPLAFQEPTAYQGNAFQEYFLQFSGTQVTGVGAIGSLEAFGTAKIIRILQTIGLTSTEAFGATNVRRMVQLAGGIASAQALGEPKVMFVLRPIGVASLEAFGTTKLIRILRAQGIASAEAFGSDRVMFVVRPIPGIASAEAFGQSDQLLRIVKPIPGISSAEAFGTTKVMFRVYPLGITSAEVFGRPSILGGIQGPYQITGVGAIASLEAFGTPKTIRLLQPIAISSLETFGTTTARRLVKPIPGISTAESFGQSDHVLRLLQPVGIASLESVAQPKLRRLLFPLGITSGEAFGTAREIGGTIVVVDFPAIAATVGLSDSVLVEITLGDGSVYFTTLADRTLTELLLTDIREIS